jgi:hypothetical protein
MKGFIKEKVLLVLLLAAFIIGSTAVLYYAISATQGAMAREVVTNRISRDMGAADEIPDFPVNENGLTYGSGGFGANNPDLILAIGIDGTTGYVLRTDLEGTGPLVRPNNPEEALRYMEELDRLAEEALRLIEELDRLAAEEGAGDDLHIRIVRERNLFLIPLYASDGQTVIGEFGISFGERR